MLTEESLKQASHLLAERDKELGYVLDKYGYPPLWSRTPTFSTLAHIILEQQVSLASANAAFEKLKSHLAGEVLPQAFLEIDDDTLRLLGYSRQKTRYTRALAEALIQENLDLSALEGMDDHEVRTQLCALPGIGNWTSDIYLSECLLRPDILPQGDIAMLEAFKVLKGLDARPSHPVFEEMTNHWRPWRSVGTRMLWHFYLSRKASQ